MTLQLRAQELPWRQIDDEIVILDGQRGSYLGVNEAGALLWRSLADGATREQLASALVDAYGLDQATAAADADTFLRSLEEQGLLAA